MAINIKEIFKSDLDPNSNSWWSQDKVDKINNNFKQLSSGGMTGPMGSQGSFGSSGLFGSQGATGSKGTLGNQGNQGSIGYSTWIGVEGTLTGSIHIFPEKQDIEYTTTAIIVGHSVPSAAAIQPVHYLSPLSSTLKIHAGQWSHPGSIESIVNLKLTTYTNDREGVETNILKDSQHRISYDSVNANDIYEEGRLRNGGSGFTRRINLGPNDTYSIRTHSSGNAFDSILISGAGTTFKNNIKINNFAFIDGDLYMPNAAGVDKVLMSTDTIGNVKWVDKHQAFPGYKDGMIISIPDWAFNSTNFDLQTQYQQGSLVQEPIRFTYGRGITGGQYEGWYLCNGREWNTGAGINETLVPNMHYTELIIDQNGIQVNVNQTNVSSIMGGHDIEMSAAYTGGNKYDVEYNTPFHGNNDDTSIGIKQTIGGTHTHYISKMVYLVKLPINDLEWEESTASAPTLQSIALSYGSTSTASCNSTTANQYRWDAPQNINTSTVWCNFSGYKLYQQTTLSYAPTGWYKFHNQFTVCSRHWNATTGSFSTSVTCPTWNNITLNYATRINLLNNGGAASYQLAEMNSTSFLTATEIKAQTTGATLPAGWYGNGDVNNPIKRYWNGTIFQGEILMHKYYGKLVMQRDYRIEKAISSGTACSNNSLGVVAIHTGSDGPIQSFLDASSIPTGITLYGNLNWSYTPLAPLGSDPLVNVANQAAPNYTGGSSNRITHVTDYDFTGGVVDNNTTMSIDNNGNPGTGSTCP